MKTPFLTYYYDYDDSEYYKSCADKLKCQIESLGGKLIIKTPILTNSYNANCLQKPKIILESLEELKSSFIWIDADCTVHRLPEEFEVFRDNDIGFVIRNHDFATPHSAIIYFNYNSNVLEFVNSWLDKCNLQFQNALDQKYDAGDHCLLINTFKEMKLNYGFASPKFASTNLQDSMITIGISPGGWGVEARKHKG